MECLKLILPFPISVNALYSGKMRRYKSKRYAAWEIAARFAIINHPVGNPIDFPVQIHYILGRPDKRVRDLSNYVKCVDDFLVHERILKDDSLIHRVIIEWGEVSNLHLSITPFKRG